MLHKKNLSIRLHPLLHKNFHHGNEASYPLIVPQLELNNFILRNLNFLLHLVLRSTPDYFPIDYTSTRTE